MPCVFSFCSLPAAGVRSFNVLRIMRQMLQFGTRRATSIAATATATEAQQWHQHPLKRPTRAALQQFHAHRPSLFVIVRVQRCVCVICMRFVYIFSCHSPYTIEAAAQSRCIVVAAAAAMALLTCYCYCLRLANTPKHANCNKN